MNHRNDHGSAGGSRNSSGGSGVRLADFTRREPDPVGTRKCHRASATAAIAAAARPSAQQATLIADPEPRNLPASAASTCLSTGSDAMTTGRRSPTTSGARRVVSAPA